ncbi:TIGR01777 family protein [Leucobacter viscericola]|uniref:TIGR01777 family protein n=1 Tax=Leucobacter viscericola TaxID=2714935 RepID=A0A6G7XI81_9MICO|nr:TIGR01777 family oxidoreductase [Leucobacter viscericola]QIK64186.1 TIGR01777 family protein [Leucobacter viscericola]
MTDTHVVIAGGSGLIGGALTQSLRADGVRVTRLVRRRALSPDEVEWLPGSGPLDPAVLEGAKAVVGLNGASIGKLPWTRSYRETLRRSRLEPTRELGRALLQLGNNAPAFLSASATGFYGSQPGERLTEGSRAGDTFLADLCVEWERAALEAQPASRVVLLRTAPLLDRRGVLKPLLTLTRIGISGPLGSGRQIWPWISLDDEVRAIRHLIDSDVSGPVNLTGPTSATASEIGRRLAQQMHRPFFVPAPAWALRLGLGADAADSLLLPDADTAPDALLASGFEFHHPTPADAIVAALGS